MTYSIPHRPPKAAMIRRPDLVEELEIRYKRKEYSMLSYEDKLGIFLELRA